MANILIVDDAKFMRKTLTDILEKEHTIIGEATNGIEAIEQYINLKPDLVTMDITMPEMTGITAVKKIKEFDPSAVIIMCSAVGQKKLIVEAIEAGAKDFIVKPFDQWTVLDAISRVLD